MRAERQKIRRVRDGGKLGAPEKFDGNHLLERRQIQFDRLREARKVGDHENDFVFVAQCVAQYFVIVRLEKFAFALTERTPAFAQCQHPAHPPEQRVRIFELGLDVAGFVVVGRVENDRQIKRLRIRAGETGVPGSEKSRALSSSMLLRSLLSSGARRRRMPRLSRALCTWAYIRYM